jgi:histidine triad (HIT) family protein
MPNPTEAPPAHDCIFCRLVRGELPAVRVLEDELVLAFMDIGQLNPGHVLVATKRHADSLLEATPDEAAAVMRAAQRIALAARAAFDAPGISLYQMNGRDGEQTVFHFHLHVLPRHAGDGVGLSWPRKEPPPAVLEQHAQRLRAALADLPAEAGGATNGI